MIELSHNDKSIAKYYKDANSFIIEYVDFDLKNSISLSLPNNKKFYIYEHRFAPYLETFLPEGYLFEIFKQLLSKEYGKVDEYLIFELLSPNIQSRIKFKSDKKESKFVAFDTDEIINNDSNDLFYTLVKTFLRKNAISGVQPKTIALLKDKERLQTKEYIIKTWGEEYRDLALNEYFCLMAVKKAGVKVPNVKLSKNGRFLIVERFDVVDGKYLGFEEVLSLMGKNRIDKYSGSYEQVAKIIYNFTTDKKSSLRDYFKTVVMNYLLKNGDAHLKNFGLLFSDNFSKIYYSPAYDVVNTVVYLYKDKPALMLNGKKVWWDSKNLIKFGQKSCLLSKKEALMAYSECIEALEFIIREVEGYIKENPDFKIGKMMIDSWRVSLEDRVIKELSDDVVGAWREY